MVPPLLVRLAAEWSCPGCRAPVPLNFREMRITQSMMNWKYGSTEPLPKRREITFFRPLPIELGGKVIASDDPVCKDCSAVQCSAVQCSAVRDNVNRNPMHVRPT